MHSLRSSLWWASVCVCLVPASSLAQQADATPSPSPSPTTTDERLAAAESSVARLLRTTVSGYVQVRGTSADGATPSNLFVRRARLSLKNGFDRGRFALSLDGGQNAVTVKDAYFDLFLAKSRGQRQGLTLRSGQFLRPFGFEIERASAEREFPERPAAWGVLFPGNRDQGFDLSIGAAPSLLLNVAIVNGGGTSSSGLSFRDADDRKDWIARVRYASFSPRIDLAASIYRGRQTIAGAAAIPAQTGFVDANGDGVRNQCEATVVVSPGKSATPPIDAARNRWSLAINVFDLFGGTARAELLGARDLTGEANAGSAQAEAPVRAWHASYVHPIGKAYGLGVRYDSFDPDTSDAIRRGGDGERTTLGAVALFDLEEQVRLSLTVERPWATAYDGAAGRAKKTRHDLWTFQAQYRF